MRLVHSLLLGCAAAVSFCIWSAAHFSLFRSNERVDPTPYALYCMVVVAAFGLDFIVSKVRGTDLLRLDLPAALRLSLRQTTVILVAVLAFVVGSRDFAISRLLLFSFFPVLYAMLLLLNVALPPLLARFLFISKRRERAVLIGSREQAERMLEWCQSKKHYGLDVIGLVTDDEGPDGAGFRVLGRFPDLDRVVVTNGVTQLIALNLPDSKDRLAEIGNLADRLGLRLLVVSNAGERAHGLNSFTESGVRFVSLREEPLECPFNRLVKKAVDIALSVPIVLFVLPSACAFVHLVHRFQSPGPLFFRQQRTGINFQTFWIYKFRTMHLDHGAESRQASEGDARVFKFGRWLRKLSLDELPQFLNVLKGEMSIVGPRPHMLEHTELFVKVAAGFHIRSLVKPGITGLAQVRGLRGETPTNEDVRRRVESDVYYLENWSLFLEGAIILRTIGHMIRPPKTAC
jgi:exopolysaccharide biosynthesis polyprenyl glycosylphosphotransferase